jgi:hypothetical protein
LVTTDSHLIQLWESATGKLLCRFNGQRDGAHIPVLSPDCRTLTTRNANGTITVWDVSGLRLAEQGHTRPLSSEEFELCWKSFADERDGEAFFRSFWKLAADAERTVVRLRERLKPVTASDPKHVRKWIADLDSKDFSRRVRAVQQLEDDDSALPILRESLKNENSLEAQQRINRIIEKLETGPKRGPNALRAYRLLQLLEQIGSVPAVHLLEVLARGAPSAMLTEEARLCLARLRTR